MTDRRNRPIRFAFPRSYDLAERSAAPGDNPDVRLLRQIIDELYLERRSAISHGLTYLARRTAISKGLPYLARRRAFSKGPTLLPGTMMPKTTL